MPAAQDGRDSHTDCSYPGCPTGFWRPTGWCTLDSQEEAPSAWCEQSYTIRVQSTLPVEGRHWEAGGGDHKWQRLALRVDYVIVLSVVTVSRVCVCVCMRMCVQMHACVYVCIYICMCVYACVCVLIHTYFIRAYTLNMHSALSTVPHLILFFKAPGSDMQANTHIKEFYWSKMWNGNFLPRNTNQGRGNELRVSNLCSGMSHTAH